MKLQVLTTSTSAWSGMRRQLVAAGHKLAHHDFAIDQVLGTAQTDKTDFQKVYLMNNKECSFQDSRAWEDGLSPR